jgi:hypothetical protein
VAYRVLVGKLYVKSSWKTLGRSGRIILKWILKKYYLVVWAEFICLGQG